MVRSHMHSSGNVVNFLTISLVYNPKYLCLLALRLCYRILFYFASIRNDLKYASLNSCAFEHQIDFQR